ncbi:MAG: amidohydrolase family protein, partial [Bacteroidetes bacterium]|nr:amidohydrolase family protein [Bacteroidota bacterium]
MLLKRVNIPGRKGLNDIYINNAIIRAIFPSGSKKEEGRFSILFEDAIAFPGLINSHDHLDFNLFPRTANKIYPNYREWGKDIHEQNKNEIEAVLKIPKGLRTEWGMYKNLLNGFTTVVNHGERLKIKNNFITVFQEYFCLHSPGFEKRWKWKLNNPFSKRLPVAMHIGEGTDEIAHNEINEVIRFNFLRKKIIGIHGVAMDEQQAAFFKALVWCPASNYFLLDKTSDLEILKQKIPIIFGTDSTLTSGWNMWEQIRLAKNKTSLSSSEILDMITVKPSTVWGLQGVGKIEETYQADIVVARKQYLKNNEDAFLSINPKDILLILHKGDIRFFDIGLIDQLPVPLATFSKVVIDGSTKYVFGKLPELMNAIKGYYPQADFSEVAIPF